MSLPVSTVEALTTYYLLIADFQKHRQVAVTSG